MQCPHCGEFENKVIESKEKISENIRIRMRICLHCGAKLPTVEKIILARYKKLNPRRKVNVQ